MGVATRAGLAIRGALSHALRRLEDSIGLWGWYSFGYWASTQLYPVTQATWWLSQYLPNFLACVLLAAALLAWTRRACADDRTRRKRLIAIGDWGCLAFSLAALVILLVAPRKPGFGPAIILGVLCIGLQNAWSIVRWGTLYAESSARDNLVRVLVSIIAIALIKLVTLGRPPVAAALVLAVMLVWARVAAVRRVPDLLAAEPRPPAKEGGAANGCAGRLDGRTLLSLWQTMLSVAAFFAIWSFMNMALATSIGHITSGNSGVSWAVVGTQLVDVGFAVGMLWWVGRGGHEVDWSVFWHVAFVVLAIGLVSISLFGATRVAQMFVSASAVLVFMFTEYLLIQVGRRACYPPGVVLGVGFAVISLIDWAIRGTVVLNEGRLPGSPFASALLLLILCVIVFLLPARSPGMQLLTMELEDRQRRFDSDIDARCAAMGAAGSLGVREVEVLTLLAHGRSVPYAAETLGLSENTVRTYRQRIYAKLDVHSRQELLDLVEGPHRDGDRDDAAVGHSSSGTRTRSSPPKLRRAEAHRD